MSDSRDCLSLADNIHDSQQEKPEAIHLGSPLHLLKVINLEAPGGRIFSVLVLSPTGLGLLFSFHIPHSSETAGPASPHLPQYDVIAASEAPPRSLCADLDKHKVKHNILGAQAFSQSSP